VSEVKPSRWLVVGVLLCVTVFGLSVPAFHTMWLAGTCGTTKFVGCTTHSTAWTWGWAIIWAALAALALAIILLMLRAFVEDWAKGPRRRWLIGIVIAGVSGVGTIVTYPAYEHEFVYRTGPAPLLYTASIWYTSVVTAFGGGFGVLFFLVCVGAIGSSRATN
jgi:hypothetical protein